MKCSMCASHGEITLMMLKLAEDEITWTSNMNLFVTKI